MSTHDEAKVDLRFQGGEKEREEETEAPKVPVQRDAKWKRTKKTERPQHVRWSQEKNHHGNEVETDQCTQTPLSANSGGIEQTELTLRTREESHGQPAVLNKNPNQTWFTSSLSFRLSSQHSKKHDLEKLESTAQREHCLHSSQGPVRNTPIAQAQVKREVSPSYYFIPANRPSEEEEVTSLPFKEEEDSKTAMLSSTLVSVLAPQWSGRIRRNKRGMAGTDIGVVGTATSESGQETQGSGQEVSEGGVLLKPQVPLETDSVGQRRQQQFLETQNQRVGERGLTLGSQVHERASTLGSSRSTVGGWYEGSTPSLKLDNPTKAPVSKPVSLDVSWGRLVNRGGEGGAVSPVTPDLHVHKGMLQASCQGDQTSLLSSKPTTSSLLFSLRRLNTVASSIHSETNISSPTNDRDGETSSPHLSPTTTNYKASETIRAHFSLTSSNDGARERSKFLPNSASPTYRTIERSRHLPLPTSNHREANTHRTQLFSTSPNYKDTEGIPFTKLPQTSRAYPNPTFPSKQTLLLSGLERLSPSERPDGTTVPISDTHLPSSPPFQYDHLDFLRSQSLPRGTTLRSTSWRKHITLENSVSNPSSPLSPTTTINNNNNNTSSLSSTSRNNNTGPSSTNDNTGVNPQISINNNNNLVTPNNTNLNRNTVTGKHTTQSTLKRTYAQDIPDQDSYRILKTQDSLNSNDRQSQKPYCLSNISFSSNNSSPASSSTLSFPIKSSKPDRYSRPSSYDTIYTPLTVFSPKTSTSSETSDTQPSLSSHRILYKSHSPNPSSRQLSLQTSIASTSLSSHRPLYSSRSLNTTSSMSQDPQNSPKSPPPVVRSQIPIVSNTHTPTSQLQAPKTAYTPTTTPQPLLLKTGYVPSIPTPTRYTRPLSPASYSPISLSIPTTQAPSTLPLSPPSSSPLVKRTFIGSLDLSPKKHQPQVEGRVTAHRAWQESHSPQRPLSPTRPLRSVGGPAIFSSLRSSSPTWATSPLSPPTPRTTKLQVWRGTSMHNLSIISDTLVKEGGQALSERVSDHTSNFTFNHTGTDSTAIGPQRETAAPLSLPDFGSFSKPRFSSPPYSTLKSSRPTLGEVTHTHTNSPQPLLSPPTSPQHYPFYGHHRARSQDSSKVVALEIDWVNNNSKQTSQENVETLVYRISKVDSSAILDSIRPAQPCFPRHTPDKRVVTEIKSNELCRLPLQHSQVIGSPSCQSYQSSNDSGALDTEKDVCKSESLPKSGVAPLQTQSPKKGLFSLRGKRDNVVATPAANLPRNPAMPQSEKPKNESEKEQKESNKIDLVLSRLRQTFRVKRLDDERTKRTPQPPSVRGASDISDVTESSGSSDREEKEKWRENDGVHKPSNSFWAGSEHTSDMTKENVRREHSQFEGFKDHTEARNRDQPCVMDLPQFESYKDESITKPKDQPSSSEISLSRRQFEAYKEERISRARKQPPQRDFSSVMRQPWDPSRSATLPAYRTSSGSPRNTFSVLHFSQKDSENDNVFHVPRIPQRKKTTSLCEPGDREFGSGDQRGSEGRLASFSSCADLKYGLEAGRSFSVTSVLSSRPSGPGRISSGPSVSSVSDLTYPALTFGEEVMTWDDCRVKGDWTIPMWDTHTTTGHKTTGDSQAVNDWSVVSDRTSRNERKTIKANFINPHKARSKSLPRNVSWSSEFTAPSPTSTTTGRMWNHGSLETSHSLWDTEGPPTPPPSPASRRISRPPSSSSASPTDIRASPDSLSPRGRLPSRGYVSNLAVFEESDSGSDMDSDTTTDDEYYLAGDGGEKETEL